MSEDLQANITYLLKAIGKPDACRGCGRAIYWVQHLNGRWTPYTPTALNHFADCPQSAAFRKGKNGTTQSDHT